MVGWLLGRQAEIALARLDEIGVPAEGDRHARGERDFYTGKVAAARFFAATVLPRITAERKIAEETTLDLMDIPESAF